MADCNVYEADIEWLRHYSGKLGKVPNEDQEERFCEGVARMVVDGGLTDSDARRAMFNQIF